MKKGAFILSLYIALILLGTVAAREPLSSIRVSFIVGACETIEGRLMPGYCSVSGKYYCNSQGKLEDTLNIRGACLMEGAGSCCPSGFECKNNICKEESNSNTAIIPLGLLLLAIIIYFIYKAKTEKHSKTRKIKKRKTRKK